MVLVWFGIVLKEIKDKQSNIKNILITSLFISGALLSKSSAILILPFLVLVGLIYLLLAKKDLKGRRIRFIGMLISLILLSFTFVTFWYSWHVRNMSTNDVVRQLETSYPKERYPEFGLQIVKDVASYTILGRGLAESVHGMLIVNNRFYNGGFIIFFKNRYY